MLRIDKERWKARLATVRWADLPVNFNGYVAALKSAVPELAKYIDHKVSKLTGNAEDGYQLFVTLEKYDDTGEQFCFEIAIAGGELAMDSPDHIHNLSPDADYGEEYGTEAGELDDETDMGDPFTHKRGMTPVRHGPETRHQPRIRRFWIGWFYQPAGSRLAA